MPRTQRPEAVKSPDGRRVAFFEADSGRRSRVVVKNADGSHPVPYDLGPLSTENHPFTGESYFFDLGWSPDGRMLAFIENRTVISGSYEWSDRLCLLTLSKKSFRGVEIPAWQLGNIRWSRNSKYVLLKAGHNVFSQKGDKTYRSEHWQVDAATGKAKKL